MTVNLVKRKMTENFYKVALCGILFIDSYALDAHKIVLDNLQADVYISISMVLLNLFSQGLISKRLVNVAGDMGAIVRV